LYGGATGICFKKEEERKKKNKKETDIYNPEKAGETVTVNDIQREE
jgi:hypothetical protein